MPVYRPTPGALLAVACFALGLFLAPAVRAADTFDQLLAQGRTLATESSWALAREKFAAAAPQAKTPAEKRQVDFELLNATMRADQPGQQNDWPAEQRWRGQNLPLVEKALAAYPNEASRDETWVGLIELRALIDEHTHYVGGTWYLDLADYLAAAEPSPAARQRYLKLLHDIVANRLQSVGADFESRLQRHLAVAAQVATDPADRIWAARQLAVLSENSRSAAPADTLALWQNALGLARGTPEEAPVAAQEFLFRARHGVATGAAPDTPADLPALLRELASRRTALQASASLWHIAEIRQALNDLERWWTDPKVLVDAPTEVLPGTPVAWRYAATGYSSITVEVWRHSLESWSHHSSDDREFIRAGITGNREVAKILDGIRGSAELIRTIAVPLGDPLAHRWQSAVASLEPLPPGFYALTAEGKNSAGRSVSVAQFVVTSAEAMIVAASDGTGTLFAVDKKTHAPLGGRPVQGVYNGAWSGTTDADGKIALPRRTDASEIRIVARLGALVDDQPLFADLAVEASPPRSLAVDFVVDRALYRPGETVRWRLIARERRAGTFAVPQKRKLRVTLELEGNDEPLLDKAEIELDTWGTAHGATTIPKTSHGGSASVAIGFADVMENTPEDQAHRAYANRVFEVDRFVPPAMTAHLDFPGSWQDLRPGREVIARVHVAWQSGGAVTGAAVSGIFSSSASDLVSGQDRPDAEDLSRNYLVRAWLDELKKRQFTATTDEHGDAELRVALPAALPDETSLNLVAHVTAEGAQPIQTEGSVSISVDSRRSEPLNWSGPVAAHPGETVDFSGRIMDGHGKALPFTGVARLIEKTWVEAWLQPDGKIDLATKGGADRFAPVRTRRARRARPDHEEALHAGYAVQTITEAPATSDADGVVHVRFALPHPGIFEIDFADHASGRPISPRFPDTWSVIAADEHSPGLALEPDGLRLLTPVSSSPDHMAVLVVGEHAPLSGVLTVAGEDTVLSQAFNFPGQAGWVTIASLPKVAHQGEIEAALFGRDPYPRSTSLPFTRHDPETVLKVEVHPERDEARPGTKTAALIRVTDHNGQPAASAVSLSVSDAAVNQLIRAEAPTDTEFARFSSWLRAGFALSHRSDDYFEGAAIRDPRPGALLNPAKTTSLNEEVSTLEQFSLAPPTYFGAAAGYDALGLVSAAPKQPADAAITIRRTFVSTAAWEPEIITDAKGEAQVLFAFPDNLTLWDFEAYAVGAGGNSFGRGVAQARTSLPFQARLQTPRFLIAGDRAELSAVLVNRTADALTGDVALAVAGQAKPEAPADLQRTGVNVSAQGEAHVGWPLAATAEGTASLAVKARAGTESDGMALDVPVLPDGFMQTTAATARLAPKASRQAFVLPLPKSPDPAPDLVAGAEGDPVEHRRLRTQVTVGLGSGGVDVVLDALPYLIDYPYGCVEQTMSRFLPAVVVRKTLADLHVAPDAVEHRILAGEPDAVARRRAKTAGLLHLDGVVAQSLARLANAQISESRQPGYGWWPGQRTSDPWMTAYVTWGLVQAQAAGVEVPVNLFPFERLDQDLAELDPGDVLAWVVLAGASVQQASVAPKTAVRPDHLAAAFARVYAARDKLGPAGRACLSFAAASLGNAGQRATLLRNLENGAQAASASTADETVHWGATAGYWHAMDGAVESTALTVLALLGLDPSHRLIDPAVHWLVLNRASSAWTNSRDSAFALLALTRYMQARKLGESSAEIDVLANGRRIGHQKIDLATQLAGRIALEIPVRDLRPGDNKIELRRTAGDSPVAAVALASSWSSYETTQPFGHLAALTRDFIRQKPVPTLAGPVKFAPALLAPGHAAAAGEQINASVTLDLSNDLEYVMIRVPKPAGCEPLNPLSGWDARIISLDTGKAGPASVAAATSREDDGAAGEKGRAIYREEQDDCSLFFLDHLDAGRWELRFPLRAVTPGNFRAAPATIEAMYIPAIRANTAATRVAIERQGGSIPPKQNIIQ